MAKKIQFYNSSYRTVLPKNKVEDCGWNKDTIIEIVRVGKHLVIKEVKESCEECGYFNAEYEKCGGSKNNKPCHEFKKEDGRDR